MYKELKKFKVSDSFTFTADDSLEQGKPLKEVVCFWFMQLEMKRINHGRSTGTIQNDGSLKIKKWWSERKDC
jgi:hypothetical protein